jgi:hypothetical protein
MSEGFSLLLLQAVKKIVAAVITVKSFFIACLFMFAMSVLLCVRVAANGLGLGEVGEIEAQMLN